MFQKEKTAKRQSDNSIGRINLIGSGTSITGEVKTDSDIRIDGSVNGDIHSDAKVVLGENARVEGNIYCKEADVHGQVVGNLHIHELLHLKTPARVDGDIHTRKLVVESGASFNGQCYMGEGAAAKSFPNAKANGQSTHKLKGEKAHAV